MIKILKLSEVDDLKQYNCLLETAKINDPYYKSEFFINFSGGLQNLHCIYFSADQIAAIYPFYMNPIPTVFGGLGKFDVISPYGYSGPIFKNMNSDQVSNFWKMSDQLLKDMGVVSEFIRFSLEFEIKNYNATVKKTLSNIKGRILSEKSLAKAAKHKVRKNITRAKREKLAEKIYEGQNIDLGVIEQFHGIYIDTMKRTKADKFFHFTTDNFKSYIDNNQANSLIILIFDGPIPISAELLLVSEDSIYSFLGGTLEGYFPKRPNDYLKYVAVKWARSKGLRHYVLGGGFGKDDSVFEYKRAFFPNDVVPYYSGRKKLNAQTYDEICDAADKFIKDNKLLTSVEMEKMRSHDFFPHYSRFSKIIQKNK